LIERREGILTVLNQSRREPPREETRKKRKALVGGKKEVVRTYPGSCVWRGGRGGKGGGLGYGGGDPLQERRLFYR